MSSSPAGIAAGSGEPTRSAYPVLKPVTACAVKQAMKRPSALSEPTKPADIAREALRRLAADRVPPTPDNFRASYYDVTGESPSDPLPVRSLRMLLTALPRATPEQLRVAQELEEALATGTWAALQGALLGITNRASRPAPNWSALLRGLMEQFDRSRDSDAHTSCRQALERLLASDQGDADLLFQRLQYLHKSWSEQVRPPATPTGPVEASGDVESEPEAPDPEEVPAERVLATLRELLVQILERACVPVTGADGRLTDQARRLASDIRAAESAEALREVIPQLTRFATRLEWAAHDQAEIRNTFLSVLRLIVENIAEVVSDDDWLEAQVSVLDELLWQPVELRNLESVEARLRAMIDTQGALRDKLRNAKAHTREVLGQFLDHLSGFAESARDYQGKVGGYKERIAAADSIDALAGLIDDVIRETEEIEKQAEHSHLELAEMKTRAEEFEREVARLQAELLQAAQLLRQDPLTGMLNRKGLEEALAREVPRARRRGAPLCVAVIDVDNFKRLNDTHGHAAGDDALVHLARVMRESLRPHDTVARYGGEEFVILLPEAELHESVRITMRLQRELTKRFFLHDNKRVLVTFSAGVTRLKGEEEADQMLERADVAMYQAKNQGKNRVVALA